MSWYKRMHLRPFAGAITVICSIAPFALNCTTRENPPVSSEDQALFSCQFTPANTTPVADSSVGGPVIPHVRIHSIYWDQNTRFQMQRDSFYRMIVDSPYLDWLSEYTPVISNTHPSQRNATIGRGSFIDSLVDNGAPAPIFQNDLGPQTLTDAMITQELRRLLRNQRFAMQPPPHPTFGQRPDNPNQEFTFTDDLFLIHTPRAFSVDARQAGAGFACPAPGFNPQGINIGGYHGTTVFDGALIWYAVLPDCGCGPNDPTGTCIQPLQVVINNLTSIASHEIAEAITDPNNNAWSGEIGDKCQAAPQASINGFVVQMEWSNNRRTCIATDCGCGDFTSDPNNCGACNNVCQPNFACVNSQCQCRTPFTRCGNRCVDLTSNGGNCGACGNTCTTNFSCVNSQCQCQAPYRLCGNRCVDPTSDASNCGACGHVCPASATQCINSQCVCPYATCHGACTDLQSDSRNCGACDHACAAGTACVQGRCNRTTIPACAHVTCRPGLHCCDDGHGHPACYPQTHPCL